MYQTWTRLCDGRYIQKGMKINFFGHLNETVTTIMNKLSVTQQNLFRRTAFGKFLESEKTVMSAKIIYNLMMRIADEKGYSGNEEMFFEIAGQLVTFSITDLALITGLKCHGEPDQKQLNIRGTSAVGKMYFMEQKNLKRDAIKLIFQSMNPDNDEIAVKVALLFFVSNLVLANNSNVYLDSFYLHLVEDLDRFNKYPWGRVLWDDMTRCLRHAAESEAIKSKARITRSGTINVFGWQLPLQVWAYETIPLIGNRFGDKYDEYNVPRLLRWSCNDAPKGKDVVDVFEGSKVSPYTIFVN